MPNLLINGSSGIAVGMATNIPPHNITEVINAVIAAINNTEVTISELISILPGPDFPTGGIICGAEGIKSAYETGRGIITIRSRSNIDEKKDKKRIIITEIPYQINKSALIEQIADNVRNKNIEGISDIRDESDKKGMSIVIELKKGTDENLVLNQLYTTTDLQTTFGINMLALEDKQPKVMNLKEIISLFIDHRKTVVIKRTKFDLTQAEEKSHILEGLKTALSNIDKVIELIKSSKDAGIARQRLIELFLLSEKQSMAILEMRLQRLTSLEQDKMNNEHADLLKSIIEYKEILASDERIRNIIKDELNDIAKRFGDKRKTEIAAEYEQIETEDLIPDAPAVIILTNSGYIKRMPIGEYRQQKRGGKGVVGATVKDEDAIEYLLTTTNHSTLLVFTNKGRVHWLKAYNVPEGSRYSKGKAIVNLINLKNEKISTIVPINAFTENHFLFMATKNGLLKKTQLSRYSKPRKGGIQGITLKENDELVKVRLTPGSLNMIIATKNGHAVKFNDNDVRSAGRIASGVRGIRLRHGDSVIGLEVAVENASLLTVTENGFGKRTMVSDYNLIHRGGSGVINIKESERNGKVVGIKTLKDDDEVMVITEKAIVIRMNAAEIPVIGRNTIGVKIMALDENDKVKSITRIT